MLGLVEAERAGARQLQVGHAAPTLFRDAGAEARAPGFQLPDGRLQVVAHQEQLVLPLPGTGVSRDFGRWALEDQPAVAGVDVWPPEHVPQERADGVRLAGEDDRVQAGDHVTWLGAK